MVYELPSSSGAGGSGSRVGGLSLSVLLLLEPGAVGVIRNMQLHPVMYPAIQHPAISRKGRLGNMVSCRSESSNISLVAKLLKENLGTRFLG